MSELLQTASSTSLPLHKKKCESMRMCKLFSFKGHIHSLSVQWICFLQIHKCCSRQVVWRNTPNDTFPQASTDESKEKHTGVRSLHKRPQFSLPLAKVHTCGSCARCAYATAQSTTLAACVNSSRSPGPHENGNDHTALSANQGWLLDRNFYRQFKRITCYGSTQNNFSLG